MAKIYLIKFITLSSLIFQILSYTNPIYDKNKVISDMKTSFWSSLEDGFYHMEGEIIPTNHTVIAFSDLNNNKYTDIITYTQENTNYIFYSHLYDKEGFKFKDKNELFSIENGDISSIRNLFVGNLYDNKICYLASFNKKNSNELLHYIKCGEDKAEPMEITSNILILNRNENDNTKILFRRNNKFKICILDSSNHLCKENEGNVEDFNYEKKLDDNPDEEKKGISLTGGLAYVDLDGNCSPDIVLSYELNNERHIEIYLSSRKENKYYLVQDIKLEGPDQYGPFAISRIKNEKSENKAPQFDILIPDIVNNKIIAYKNKKDLKYSWNTYFCSENDNEKEIPKEEIFEFENTYNLSKIDNSVTILDNSSITVIRPGDFLGSSIPGILVKQNVKNSATSVISLYEKNDKNFELYLRIDNTKIGTPKSAVFFDINESGSLGLIVQNEAKENHFFFNYRKNTYFIKSKLMNYEKDKLNTDTNLGAYYRYIVTDQSGDRHMDISYQLAQTSDMNIPLPYSLIGLGNTNNYVENYQIISGNFYRDKHLFDDSDARNFKGYTPIIPNTQMVIFKFKNSDRKYEWYADLIVEPTESLIVIILSLIGVMLIILGVIIYLHVREAKEEEKETNKFKSWFT